jgi:alkylation response protein AidB-like acyl-CoA dehydrogenase
MTSEADQSVVDAIAQFCRTVLEPSAATIDAQEEFATRHLPALSDIGLMGLNLPERWGGAGVNAYTLFEGTTAMAHACASTASMVTAHWLATDSILHAGDDVQCERWLPGAATGKSLGAFGLTEPNAGSNPADMTTFATRDGEHYQIKGRKQFISNAAAADFIVIYAKTDREAGARGISAFVIEPKSGGVEFGSAERTMGLRGGHVFEVIIDTEVPQSHRLGAEGSGFRTALRVLDAGRLEIAACCIGIAEAALARAKEWLQTRNVGGAPIGEFQGLQWMLADMVTDVAAARALAFVAVAKRSRSERFGLEASIAKLFASEMAGRVTDKALQMHGGYGYTRDFPLERYVRDARIMRIYEGSSEIQRNIIARSVLASR